MALRKIESTSSQIMQMAYSISHVSEEQEIFLDTAAKRIMAVGEISTQTVKTSKQITLSMQILSKIEDQLRILVEDFKVEKQEGENQDKNRSFIKSESEKEDHRKDDQKIAPTI